MLYGTQETLEDNLVRLLLRSPSHMKGLHKQVKDAGRVVSLRAIYKAVDSLMAEDVLVKVGKSVWINQEWVRKLRDHLSAPLPSLGRGEKISYTFTSIEHLDAFWKTIAFQLEEYERDGQVFFYNPHNFWAAMPSRRASEDAYYSHFKKEKKRAYFTVGGEARADRDFKRIYQNDYLQVDARAQGGISRRDHITILGDFVITVRISSVLAKKIDALYESGQPIEALLPKMFQACVMYGKTKLLFEHNIGKAKKLRAKLSAGFHIPA